MSDGSFSERHFTHTSKKTSAMCHTTKVVARVVATVQTREKSGKSMGNEFYVAPKMFWQTIQWLRKGGEAMNYKL